MTECLDATQVEVLQVAPVAPGQTLVVIFDNEIDKLDVAAHLVIKFTDTDGATYTWATIGVYDLNGETTIAPIECYYGAGSHLHLVGVATDPYHLDEIVSAARQNIAARTRL